MTKSFSLIAALLPRLLPVGGFFYPSSILRSPSLVNHGVNLLSLGKAPSTQVWATINDPLLDERQDVALQALTRLVKRQETELNETKRLLKRLSVGNDKASSDVNGDDDIETFESMEMAKSINAGVDYGFVSRSQGSPHERLGGLPVPGIESKSAPFKEYGPPGNIFTLGSQQFTRNLKAIIGEYEDQEETDLTSAQKRLHAKLKKLTLDSSAIWERETADGPIQAPLVIKVPYLVLCFFLDRVFEGRYVPSRFFLLETVARMPYFSYITMLHLYETLGFWRRSADIKRVHFAEEWNEYHHLLIMESLGGDQAWWVRFLAQHSAVAYFVILSLLWALSPSLSYKFSELLETHAVNTYGQLLDENEELLKELPPSIAAVEYYAFGASDPLFGEYQTTALAQDREIRQPGRNMRTLYDVFAAILADEGDHVGTMKACLDPNVEVASPSIERKVITGIALAAAFGYFLSNGGVADFGDIGETVGNLVDGLGPGLTESAGSGEVADIVEGADAVAKTAALSGAIEVLSAFGENIVKDEEERDLVGLGTDLLEAGTVGAVLAQFRGLMLDFIGTLAKLLSSLL